jgi:hypothetical protein
LSHAALVIMVMLTGESIHAQQEVVDVIELAEAVVFAQGGGGFNVERFVTQVMEDTTFQHAFLNTKFYPHHLSTELTVRNKDERAAAKLYREGYLRCTTSVAEWVLDSVKETGKLRDRDGELRYITAQMYDDVFFSNGSYRRVARSVQQRQMMDRSSRLAKYKSELKQFMFDPGKEIGSVPLIGDKMALFDPEMVPYYEYKLDAAPVNGRYCWVFSAVAKQGVRDNATVIKDMHTWFDQETNQVLGREYRLAHNTVLLEFDIRIRVENTHVQGVLVPSRVSYDGRWDLPFKKPEIVDFWLAYDDWSVLP